MQTDELKMLTTTALDKLATLLDEGQSDRLTALFKTMARFHKYSFGNVALIATQRSTATHVAGFQAWRKLNRCVRKGEKGIAILAPIIGRRRDAGADDAKAVLGFRAAFPCSPTRDRAAGVRSRLPASANARAPSRPCFVRPLRLPSCQPLVFDSLFFAPRLRLCSPKRIAAAARTPRRRRGMPDGACQVGINLSRPRHWRRASAVRS